MKITELVRRALLEIGEDVEREGLQKTPARVEEMVGFLTEGYRQNLAEVINGAIFTEAVDDMIVVKDIEFFSLCEHHLLPFYGKCHIGYLPRGKILGLSKFPRIVNMYSRRLQLQERLTSQIANAVMEVLDPSGVGVVIEAGHLCMMMRGVEKQAAVAVTSTLLGTFIESDKTRSEFLKLIGKS
jgi:GTP cyclohydrolase I